MKLKKRIQVLAAVLLTIAVSVGVTLAFLKSEVSEENIMTIGEVHIKLLEYQRVNTDKVGEAAVVEQFDNGKLLVPTVITDPSASEKFSYDVNYGSVGTSYVNWGSEANNIKADYKTPIWNPKNISNEMDKMVFVKNTGNYNAYVRLYFAFEAGNYVRYERFSEMVHLNLNETDWKWDWLEEAENQITDINGTRYFIATATYNKPLAPDSVTEISLSQIALDSLATNNEAAGFGSEYSVLVKAQAIQADGFEGIGGLVDGAPDPSKDAPCALNEGFGSDIPFKNMKKLTFVDLYTALHYLNADKSSDTNKITSKVTSITFGLTEKYKDEVAGREGVLVANKKSGVDENGNVTTPEADFTAYAYYVPNGEKYDIYVLADDWSIYTPVDSEKLFYNMKALTKVDTANMDVSRTENMKSMFMGCEALTSLDVSKWDVSKVKSMSTTFTYCYGLKELDVSGWDVGNVTTMASMFYDCTALTSLDVTNWDVKNVTDMTKLFYNCQKLNALNVSNWEVDNVTTMRYMFYFCEALESLTLNSWNVSNVTTFERMFSSCYALTSLNVSGWDTTSATNMAFMFFECQKLGTIDVSSFVLDGVTTIKGMFNKCFAVQKLDVQNWNVSSVTNMSLVFRECNAVVTLDLSGWVTSNVTTTTAMFALSENLKTIYVGNGWDISHVEDQYIGTEDELSTRRMFEGCTSLQGGAGTTLAKIDAIEGIKDEDVINKTYARIDCGIDGTDTQSPGYLTYKAPPADATT